LTARIVLTRAAFCLDVDLSVAPGEVLAVLGASGAGKTTLLRTLAGLARPTRGRITNGATVWAETEAGVSLPVAERSVGVVFQDQRLFPHLSVLDNVTFSATVRGVRADVARRTGSAWLRHLGMSELSGRKPAELSGGQAQRVALARALASGPEVLLLDEPFSALDGSTRLRVRSVLREYLSTFLGPCLLITHDPVEALALADRILVLESGRIVQDATPVEITRYPASEYVAHLMGLDLQEPRVPPGDPRGASSGS
jgi:molybdate transport system ATP-binding protein